MMPMTPNARKTTGMVILTVDDSDIILDILEFTLTGAGFNVARATDGVEAIEWLENNRADIITTDINMPRMNGFGLIEHLQNRNDFGHPPIIVISTECDEESVRKAIVAGASDWLVKPFDPTFSNNLGKTTVNERGGRLVAVVAHEVA
jgi:two-component system, chemotaxis family, chemotaxis protein CheY